MYDTHITNSYVEVTHHFNNVISMYVTNQRLYTFCDTRSLFIGEIDEMKKDKIILVYVHCVMLLS